MIENAPNSRRGGAPLAIIALLVVAGNMRLLMASLPPLTERIADDLRIGGGAIGAFTAIPVLCMGLLAPAASRISQRLGPGIVVSVGMALVSVGTLARGLGEPELWKLYIGTLLGGVGIALAGTLVPGLVKVLFPARLAGLGTGLTMFAMMAMAGFASAAAVPAANAFGGWHVSLASWSLLGAAGLLLWFPIMRNNPEQMHHASAQFRTRLPLPWKHPTAVALTAYLTLQSWQFYSSFAWLSPSYEALGWSPGDAGLLMAVFALGQVFSGVFGPVLADRVSDIRYLLFGAGALNVSALVGIVFWPNAAPWAWATTLGAGQGSAFALALVLLTRYSATMADVARLTALCYLVSFSLASLGPLAMGFLRDVTESTTAIWLTLLLCMLPQLGVAFALSPRRQQIS